LSGGEGDDAPLGDLFGLGAGALPPTSARIVRLAGEIAGGPPERPDYLHSVLCQVGLPRRRVRVEGTTFERANGNASLLIEAGKLWNGRDWAPQPLPYGTRPRLALVHLSSEAVRTRSPAVEVGHSVREFLLRLGISTGGEEYANFGRQMRALAACRMSLGVGLETLEAKPIRRFAAWVGSSPHQRALWPGVIELTPEFYESLSDSAVPLDARALGALKHSALALDVYSWLAHRLHRIRDRAGTKLSWANLRAQFGQEYRDPKDFKREMAKALRAVLAVYPDARVEQVAGGLVLMPSRSPVPKMVVQLGPKRA
jgi:replication initiator protein